MRPYASSGQQLRFRGICGRLGHQSRQGSVEAILHIRIWGHRNVVAIVRENVPTFVLTVCTLIYLVIRGETLIEDVAVRSEGPIALQPPIVTSLKF